MYEYIHHCILHFAASGTWYLDSIIYGEFGPGTRYQVPGMVPRI